MKIFKVEIRGASDSTFFVKESEVNKLLIVLLQKGFLLKEAFQGEDFFLEGERNVVSIAPIRLAGAEGIKRFMEITEK